MTILVISKSFNHLHTLFLQTVEEGNVDACPITKETYDARAAAQKPDSGGQSVFHCLSDNDRRKWEKGVQPSRVLGGWLICLYVKRNMQ